MGMLARNMQQAYVTLCDEVCRRIQRNLHSLWCVCLYVAKRARGQRNAVLAKVLGLSLSS
jgi:hypothetical protein